MSDMGPPHENDQDPDACPKCLNLIGPRSHWKDDGFVGYTCAMANEVNLRVQDAVVDERNRQDGHWGPVQDLAHSPERWFAIWMEEIGEVAKALVESKPDEVITELVQAVAVGHSWLESIEWASRVRHDEENVFKVRHQRAIDATDRYEERYPEPSS